MSRLLETTIFDPTVSSTTVFMPEMKTPYSLTSCFAFSDIVDLDGINADLGTNILSALRQKGWYSNIDLTTIEWISSQAFASKLW